MSHDTLFGHFFFLPYWSLLGFLTFHFYGICVWMYIYCVCVSLFLWIFFFVYVSLFSFSSCWFVSIAGSFSKDEKKERLEFDGWGGVEDLRGYEGGKTMVRIYCVKKFTFHFKKIVSILFRKKRFFYCLVHKY